MATVATSAPPRHIPVPAAAEAAPSVLPAVAKPVKNKGLWTDWAALMFWTVCFGLMALIHFKDLLVTLLR